MTMIPKQTPAGAAPQALDDSVQEPPLSKPPGSYAQHPISAAFPAMSDAEFAALVEDIKAHGLRAPIMLYEGQVLDGWHRYRACREAGVEPATVEFAGRTEEAVALVVSMNARRRHLDTGQVALFTVEYLLPRFEAEARERQCAGKEAEPTDLCATRRTGRKRRTAGIG